MSTTNEFNTPKREDKGTDVTPAVTPAPTPQP
jgi:hypothetical protein